MPSVIQEKLKLLPLFSFDIQLSKWQTSIHESKRRESNILNTQRQGHVYNGFILVLFWLFFNLFLVMLLTLFFKILFFIHLFDGLKIPIKKGSVSCRSFFSHQSASSSMHQSFSRVTGNLKSPTAPLGQFFFFFEDLPSILLSASWSESGCRRCDGWWRAEIFMSPFCPHVSSSYHSFLTIPAGKQFPLDALVTCTGPSRLCGYFLFFFSGGTLRADRQSFCSSFEALLFLLFLLTGGDRFHRSVSWHLSFSLRLKRCSPMTVVTCRSSFLSASVFLSVCWLRWHRTWFFSLC